MIALIATFMFFYMRPTEPKVTEGAEAAQEIWVVVSSSPDWDINDPVIAPTDDKTRWTFRANVAHAGGATLLPAYGLVDFKCDEGDQPIECWKITQVIMDGQPMKPNQ